MLLHVVLSSLPGLLIALRVWSELPVNEMLARLSLPGASPFLALLEVNLDVLGIPSTHFSPAQRRRPFPLDVSRP